MCHFKRVEILAYKMLNFNKIGLDLRYERGFNDNEATFINDNIGTSLGSRIDTRPDQLILSLSIAL